MIQTTITYTRPSLEVEYDYVGIIDGLVATDRTKFRITEELIDFFNDNEVQTATARVRSGGELLGALEAFRRDAATGKKFMLHFVSHGNDHGIAAADDFCDWATLGPFLQRVHSATGETLLLNMSTCRGLHGIKITGESGPYPFFGLIGAKEDLYVDDALRANKTLYEKWLTGLPVQQLVPETNRELGKDLLFNISAEGYRKLSSSA